MTARTEIRCILRWSVFLLFIVHSYSMIIYYIYYYHIVSSSLIYQYYQLCLDSSNNEASTCSPFFKIINCKVLEHHCPSPSLKCKVLTRDWSHFAKLERIGIGGHRCWIVESWSVQLLDFWSYVIMQTLIGIPKVNRNYPTHLVMLAIPGLEDDGFLFKVKAPWTRTLGPHVAGVWLNQWLVNCAVPKTVYLGRFGRQLQFHCHQS